MDEVKIEKVFKMGLDHATFRELTLLTATLPTGDRLEEVLNELRIREQRCGEVHLSDDEMNEFATQERTFWDHRDSLVAGHGIPPHTREDRLKRLTKELTRFRNFDRRSSTRQAVRAKQIALHRWLIREIEEGRR